MQYLIITHSIVRWAIIIIGVIALIKFVYGWLAKKSFSPMDQGIMSGFVGLIDIQTLIGVILFIWRFTQTGLERYRAEHAFTMILALILAHLSRRWREADDITKFRNYALIIIGVFVLVLLGISVLPSRIIW